jgi:integrase
MAHGDGLRRNRCGVWCWRWVIPVDLRQGLGAREVSRSLGTASRREAVAASLPLRLFAFELVARVRAGATLSNDKMMDLLRQAKVSVRATVDREELEAESDARAIIDIAHQRQLADKDAEVQRSRQIAKAGIWRAVGLGKEQLLAAQDAHTEQLVKVVTTATISASKGSAQAAAAGAAAVVEASRDKSGLLLSVAVDSYLRERAARDAGNEKTRLKLKTALQLLVDGVGDRAINKVTRAVLTTFLERLRRYPSNVTKKATLAGMTFAQLTELDANLGEDLLADNTVNGHMTRISGMFKWALHSEEYRLTVNPASGLTIAKPDAVKRKPFTEAQLVALFLHDSFKSRSFMHPHYFWLMPMAALSGMRLNEICQLQLVDIKQIDGVDIMSCADLDEGRRGKTDNAMRQVPIHDELKRLGLLRWVDQLRARGEVQLFPELNDRRDGHGTAPSRWFQGYRAACGIAGKQVYVFHSFRHYFINKCLSAREQPHNIAAVVGHETGLITVDIYGREFDIKVLHEVVNKVTLPAEVLALIPALEEVNFTKKPVPPSRLGARKSREKRISDAASRHAKKIA